MAPVRNPIPPVVASKKDGDPTQEAFAFWMGTACGGLLIVGFSGAAAKRTQPWVPLFVEVTAWP